MTQAENSPIHVLIDTSILVSLRADHILVECIRTLARLEKVVVYIPKIVLDEFRTRIELRDSELIESCLKALKKLPRRIQGSNTEALQHELEVAKSNCRSAAAEDTATLIERWGAIELGLHVDDLTNALDAYFSGSGPVRSPKCRDDIPDALIWASAKRLAHEVGHVHVLVLDSALYEACNVTPALTPHKSLHGLLSTQMSSALLEWAVIAAPKDWIEAVEKARPDLERIVSERLGDAVWGRQCWIDLRPGTETWEHFGDAFIGDVTGGKVLSVINFEAQDAKVIGDRYIAVPFQTLMELEVEIYPDVTYVGPQYKVGGTLAIQVDLDEKAWTQQHVTQEKFVLYPDHENLDLEIEMFDYHGVEQLWRPG